MTRPKSVICPKCNSEMSDFDDGWYCDDFWSDDTLAANAVLHYLTYGEGKAQWDARAKKEETMLKQWIEWAHQGAGR